MSASIAVLAVTTLYVSVTSAQLPSLSASYSGEGTFYGSQSLAGSGHCSFQFSNSYALPWSSGVSTPLALNAPQYLDSTPCGLCVAYQGDGSGTGSTPIPAAINYGLVSDECPECSSGDLDLALSGDGRWGIDWYPVQCAVGGSTFQYSFQGSNNFYIKLMIANARVPVQSVQLNGQAMAKSPDNYWILTTGGPFYFPLPITLTSILGDTVSDTVPDTGFSQTQAGSGRAQFPLRIEYGSVGDSSNGGRKLMSLLPAGSKKTQTTWADLFSGPASPPPSVEQEEVSADGRDADKRIRTMPAWSQCGGNGGQCAIQQHPGGDNDFSNCVDDVWENTVCQAGTSCRRAQAGMWQCAPLDSVSVFNSIVHKTAKNGTIYAHHSQCGGMDVCPSGGCSDAPWSKNGTCITDTTCSRWGSEFWQCL